MKLKERIHRIWYWRKYRKFKGFEKRLDVALAKKAVMQRDREVDQIILKHQITKHMGKFLKVKARSKFIPRTHKSDEICRQEVHARFGERMAELGIELKQDLTLCITQ